MSDPKMMTARMFLRGGYRVAEEPTVVVVTVDGEPRPLGTWIPAGYEEPGTKAGPGAEVVIARHVPPYDAVRPVPKVKR